MNTSLYKSNLFRTPMRYMFFFFFTICCICFLPVFFISNNLNANNYFQLSIFFLFNLSLPLFIFWYYGVLSVSSTGISLYRVNNLIWTDVDEAIKIKVFGLPYICIKRKKGMNWYVPLYFKGQIPLSEMLLKTVPTDNPLYHAIRDKE